MTTITHSINQKDKKIRDQWLFATLCWFIFLPILSSALIIALSEERSYFGPVLGTTVGGLISLWITWHCSYKNPELLGLPSY